MRITVMEYWESTATMSTVYNIIYAENVYYIIIGTTSHVFLHTHLLEMKRKKERNKIEISSIEIFQGTDHFYLVII